MDLDLLRVFMSCFGCVTYCIKCSICLRQNRGSGFECTTCSPKGGGQKAWGSHVSSILGHWITEYILVFCRYFTHPWVSPYEPAYSCSNLILPNLSDQPLAVLTGPQYAGLTIMWDSSGFAPGFAGFDPSIFRSLSSRNSLII